MPVQAVPKAVVTKTGVTVETNYCRKCMRTLPAKSFYDAVDNGAIDSNGLLSVCKPCTQKIYDALFKENHSLEKTLHKMCISMNVKFSNEALDATRAHIKTLQDNGKHVNSVFGIYKTKLIATKKSMTKSGAVDMTYEDVTAIYTKGEEDVIKDIAIPRDRVLFWGTDLPREDILFLEREYANFEATHKADDHAKVVLLKQVCYTELDIRNTRIAGDDPQKQIKVLQDLMKSLEISPNAVSNASQGDGDVAFSDWIVAIETMEPAQWLLSDPRGDMYRDVGDVDKYYNDYIVRALKNLINGSKDFNITDSDLDVDWTEEELEESDILTGVVEE